MSELQPPPPHGRPWAFINYAPPPEPEHKGNRAERRKAAAKARGKGKRHAR